MLVADADKKGIPRVVDTIFVSSKTKYNIRALCNLMYRTAFDIRTTGGKERLLDQKVPASYLAFEKVNYFSRKIVQIFGLLFSIFRLLRISLDIIVDSCRTWR